MKFGNIKIKNVIANDTVSMSLREAFGDRREPYATKQSLRFETEIASSNRTPSSRSILLAMTTMILLLPLIASAQTPKPLEMHGLHPGMSTREIFLYAHAPIDTLQWSGKETENVLAFKGIYLDDTGQFKINVTGQDIMRVTFIAKTRSVDQNGAAFHRMIEKITKLLGKPAQDYHNKYRIVTWNAGAEQLVLTTADGGKFYSVGLTGGGRAK
jgi:hypothetical protein